MRAGRNLRGEFGPLAGCLFALLLSCGEPAGTPAPRESGPAPAGVEGGDVPGLLMRLRSEDIQVWAEAWTTVLGLAPEDAHLAPKLLEGLSDESAEVRLAAATALIRVGTAVGPAVRELLRHAVEGDRRQRARRSLEEGGPDVATYLLEELTKGEWSRRIEVAGILARMNEPAVDRVVERLAGEKGRGECLEVLLRVEPTLLPAPEALLPALSDPQQTVRWKAVRVLGRMTERADEVVPMLARALADPWDAVRKEAADSLARLGEAAAPAVPALLEASKDRERDVRRSALTALGAVGHGSTEVLDCLVEALEDDLDWHARSAAVGILKEMGPGAGEALPALEKALRDRQPLVRRKAALAVLTLGGDADAAFETVRDLIDGMSAAHRGSLYWSLAKIPAHRGGTLELLLEALESGSYEIRKSTLAALSILGPDAAPAVPHLLEMLRSGSWLDTARTLAAIGEPAVPELEAALRNLKPAQRAYAALALWMIHRDASRIMPAVLEVLDSEVDWVRDVGAYAAGHIGPDARDAVPKLIRRLGEADPPYAALFALQRMGRAAERALPALEKLRAVEDLSEAAAAEIEAIREDLDR